jgi:hypothetical protein
MAPTPSEDEYQEPQHIPGQYKIIIGHTLMITIPMILLAVSMLVMVIPFNDELKNIEGYSYKKYFFLRQIPTYSLLFVTTLTSLLSLLLIPSMLTLTTFIHADDILRMTEADDYSKLPTTFEFGLLLRVLSGSPSAYCRSLGRVFKRPLKEHHVLCRAVLLSSGVLAVWFVPAYLMFDKTHFTDVG